MGTIIKGLLIYLVNHLEDLTKYFAGLSQKIKEKHKLEDAKNTDNAISVDDDDAIVKQLRSLADKVEARKRIS